MATYQPHGSGQAPVNCGLCETDRPIQWKCMDCSLLMCDHCKDKVHSKFKNGLDHKIIDKNEIGLHREVLDFTNIKCHEHTGQLSCLYCKTCDIFVCPSCIAKDHKKHDLIEIGDVYKTNVESLKRKQNEMTKKDSGMKVKKDDLNKTMSARISMYSKVRQNILTHEKIIDKQVKKYFKELVDKLDQSHETYLTLVKPDLNALSLFTKETEDKVNEVQELIETSNATEFFKGATMMQISAEIQEPQTKQSYFSPLQFVPGNINQSHVGSLQDEIRLSKETKISLVIKKEYQTELEIIAFVSPCLDQSIWVSSGNYKVLQRVIPVENNLKVMSTFNIFVCGMAVSPFNQLLVCVSGKTRLRQISSNGELIDSVYDVTPFIPTAVHLSSGNKLIVGAQQVKLGRSAVIIMNKKGDKETVYEHDKHNQPLFTNPWHISSTSNGNIHVIDKISDDNRKVVVLGQEGNIINEYAGYSILHKSTPFKPFNIATSPSDNVVVISLNTSILHILNDNGFLLSYFNFKEVCMQSPCSFAFNRSGQLYIGCTRAAGIQTKEAKLYAIDIAGF
ncbi:uncharacterized protein [Mytilus edulis]|uniref:uncharacterized protein n=1 Tax=Mytilus edulis TaxID=6550 RepID=UPI0039F01C87